MLRSALKIGLAVLLTCTALSDFAAADDIHISGIVAFSALDGAPDDHDGVANGVFTVDDGNLVIDGTIQCNDGPPLPGNAGACPIRIFVSGNLVLEAGSAIQAENRSGGGNGGNITLETGGDLILRGASGPLSGAVVSSGSLMGSGTAGAISATVGGAVELEAGSTLSASAAGGSAGAVGVEADGAIRIAGLVASGPGTSILSSRWSGAVLAGGSSGQKGGTILLRSMSAAEPGILIEATATVASQGQSSGPQFVLLEACGIEVHGLVAAVSKTDTPARVALRSGKGILVNGRDLAVGSGSHLGRVRADSTEGGTATHLLDLFAEGDIQVFGPTSGTTDLFVASANPGTQAQRTGGSVNAVSLAGALVASGNAFDAGRALSGNKGGKIDLRSAGDAVLEDAHLRAVGGYLTSSGSRKGGQISIRSYSGEIRWTFGTGDVRPTGSGTSASSRGTIMLTSCAGIDTTGTTFPVLGSPVAPFPVEADGVCSPAAPSLPSGEPPLSVCNEPPVAQDDAFTTAEDTQLSGGNVLADNGSGADSDPNGDTLTVNTTPVSGPSNGTLTLNADGTFTYDPDLDFNGTDTFEYEVSDGNGGTDVGLVTITVTPENDAPVARDDAFTTAEDTQLSVGNVLADNGSGADSDADGDTLTVNTTPVSGPLNGTLTLNSDGTFTYDPDLNFNGTDTFEYEVLDGNGGTDVGLVTITVTPENDAPVARDDAFTTAEDIQLSGGNVLFDNGAGADSDVDGDTLTVNPTPVSGPSNGALTLNADGTFTYDPDLNFNGTDTFQYQVLDGNGGTDIGLVTITVNAVNDPPVANLDAADITEEAPNVAAANTVSGNVLTNDTDPDSSLTVSAVAGGSVGSPRAGNYGSVIINSDGSFTYTLDDSNPAVNALAPGSTLTDPFGYTASDGSLTSSSTLTVTIHGADDPPAPDDDAFDFIGNTQLEVDRDTASTPEVLATTPPVPAALGVLDGDADPDGGPAITISGIVGCGDPSNCVLAGQGTVSLQPDGSFSFVPEAGDTDLTASFQYTLTGNPIPATVTLNRKERVWYVNNDDGGGTGVSNDPFDTLAQAQAASVDGDYIFVHFGDGTSTNQTAGIVLKNGQHLIGEHAGLTVQVPGPGTFNGTPLPTAVSLATPVPGNRPLIDHSGAGNNAVSAIDAVPIEIVGLSLMSVDANAIDLTNGVALPANAALSIEENVIRGAGAEGIDVNLNADATGTLALNITGNNWDTAGTHTGNAVDINRAAGTLNLNFSGNTNILSSVANAVVIASNSLSSLNVTGFSGNSVHQNTVGIGINVSNATFDQTPGGTFQTVSGGMTTVGTAGNGVGGSGMILSGVAGDLSFSNLQIVADNGTGLQASGTAPYTGSAGFQITLANTAATKTVTATGGPALDLTAVSANLPSQTPVATQMTVTSTNSPTTGVALNSVTGVFSAGSSSSISNITSGTGTAFQVGSSSATVSYAGTITNVNGKGVDLTSNTGSIAFTGTLTLTSGTNTAFNATGGGTVTTTDTASTLTTTTGMALNVANTTIGAGGLKFRSIMAGTPASGPTHGIVLNNTGSSGGLTVSGTGSAGSGGTIQRAATGISLTSTRDVSLSHMQLNDFTDFAIRGSSVVNFTLANTTINGTNGNDAGADEGSMRFTELTGSASITNTSISGSVETNLRVVNTTGSLNRLTLSNTTIGTNSTTTGDDGLFFEAQATAAAMNVTVQNSFFTASRGDLAQFNNASSGTMDVIVSGTAFSDNHPAIVAGGGGVVLGAVAGTMTYNVNTNTFRDATGTALAVSCGNAGVSCVGRLEGNQIGLAGTPNSGSTNASGIAVVNSGGGTMTSLVNNNVIRQYNNHGILLQAGQTGGNPTSFNATVTNNTIGNPGTINTDFNGIHLNNGTLPGENFISCVDIRTNSIAGAGTGPTVPNNADFRLRQRQSTTVRLPGYGGANNNDAAVVAFVSGNQTTVTTGAASNTVPTGGGFVGGAACVQP